MSRSTRRPCGGIPQHRTSTPPQQANSHPLAQSNLGPTMSRRTALKTMLGVGVVATGLLTFPLAPLAAEASQETINKLSEAQAAYDAAQAQLDSIASEYAELSEALESTVSQIEQVQDQIDAKQSDLDAKQSELSARLAKNYKTGNTDFLSVLLNSASFEQLVTSLLYFGKINASDAQLIDEVRQAKSELEQQYADLERLKEDQSSQLELVKAKQQEASDVVAGLSDDVKELMTQRDAEIVAAAEEEQRQAQAAAAAAAAAAASNNSWSSGGGSYDSGSSGNSSENVSGRGAAIVAATSRVSSPGGGLCAMWVSQVYQAAGCGYPGGNANDMYYNFCTSSNRGSIEPGMIVAVPRHNHTDAGRIYGHVGIYLGGGMVRHNIGTIATWSLDQWISYYGTLATPRWGWA